MTLLQGRLRLARRALYRRIGAKVGRLGLATSWKRCHAVGRQRADRRPEVDDAAIALIGLQRVDVLAYPSESVAARLEIERLDHAVRQRIAEMPPSFELGCRC